MINSSELPESTAGSKRRLERSYSNLTTSHLKSTTGLRRAVSKECAALPCTARFLQGHRRSCMFWSRIKWVAEWIWGARPEDRDSNRYQVSRVLEREFTIEEVRRGRGKTGQIYLYMLGSVGCNCTLSGICIHPVPLLFCPFPILFIHIHHFAAEVEVEVGTTTGWTLYNQLAFGAIF